MKWWRQIVSYLPSVFLGLLLVVPLASLLWLILFTDTFSVQTVTVVDARPHTAQQVQTIADQFSGKSILFLQTNILEQQILVEVPQVRTIHSARKLPETLKLIIQEKTPRALLLAQGKYYFLDESGSAYEEARLDTLPGIILPTLKVSDTGATVTIGTQVVEPEFIHFVEQVQEKLPTVTPGEVVEIRIPSLSAREVHFRLSNNWEVRFDSTRAASGQLGVLEQLVRTTIPLEAQATLEYIDLRIPNRVYYKSRGAAPTAASGTPQPRPETETPPESAPAADGARQEAE